MFETVDKESFYRDPTDPHTYTVHFPREQIYYPPATLPEAQQVVRSKFPTAIFAPGFEVERYCYGHRAMLAVENAKDWEALQAAIATGDDQQKRRLVCAYITQHRDAP